MGAVVRFYVAVKDGFVIGARSTTRRFTHVMVHTNANGSFASFHPSAAQAVEARHSFVSHPVKGLARAIETRRRLAVGDVYDPAEAVKGGGLEVDGEYHQRRSPAFLIVRRGVAL